MLKFKDIAPYAWYQSRYRKDLLGFQVNNYSHMEEVPRHFPLETTPPPRP